MGRRTLVPEVNFSALAGTVSWVTSDVTAIKIAPVAMTKKAVQKQPVRP